MDSLSTVDALLHDSVNVFRQFKPVPLPLSKFKSLYLLTAYYILKSASSVSYSPMLLVRNRLLPLVRLINL
jgi:hypothetical protein